MIDREARSRLRDALRLLVNGWMVTDDFDDFYWTHCERSPDRAVSEIGGFGFSLYSDLLWGYHLQGRFAPAEQELQAADRCDLFLRTELDYEWPDPPGLTGPTYVAGWLSALPWSAALLFVALAILVLANGHPLPFLLMATMAGALVGLGLLPWTWHRRVTERRWRRFQAAGDHAVWPFIRRSDYERPLAELQEKRR